MTGFENATAPVGKVRDPARNLPRAILGGTALVGLLYLLSSSAVLLLLPADVVANSPAPFADAIRRDRRRSTRHYWPPSPLRSARSGRNNCGILVTGELGYAMAKRRQLPAAMARTRGANTPVVAQVVASDPVDPAGARQQQPDDRRPVHLHHPADHFGDLVRLYSRRRSPPGPSCNTLRRADRPHPRRTVHRFCFLGRGVRGQSVVPRAAGHRTGRLRHHAPAQFARDHPGAGGRSSRASRNKPPQLLARSCAGTPRSSPAAPAT